MKMGARVLQVKQSLRFVARNCFFSGWREVKGTTTLGWFFDCAGYCYTERSNIVLLRSEIVN